jgi:hypothetical protein
LTKPSYSSHELNSGLRCISLKIDISLLKTNHTGVDRWDIDLPGAPILSASFAERVGEQRTIAEPPVLSIETNLYYLCILIPEISLL